MSERSSFVTEYIYCDECFEAVKEVMCGREKYLCSLAIPSWTGKELPIVAGKTGGLGGGDDVILMEDELIPELKKRICHTVRVAVIYESFCKFYIVAPENDP